MTLMTMEGVVFRALHGRCVFDGFVITFMFNHLGTNSGGRPIIDPNCFLTTYIHILASGVFLLYVTCSHPSNACTHMWDLGVTREIR